MYGSMHKNLPSSCDM